MNLFLKLGVHGGESGVVARKLPKGSLLGKVPTSLVPLKDPDTESEVEKAPPKVAPTIWGVSSLFEQGKSTETDQTSSSSFSSSDVSTPDAGSKQDRKLSFYDQVLVCPIPKHEAYSKRIKDLLWTHAEDAARNVERNAIEYAAEGWNVSGVLDDDEMYQDPATGEKIHPIHVQIWRAQTGMDCANLYAP